MIRAFFFNGPRALRLAEKTPETCGFPTDELRVTRLASHLVPAFHYLG